MKITSNQDLASLTLSLISPSRLRGLALRSDVPCSTQAGEYRRNGKKRRIQRRLSRASAFPGMLLDPPLDPISPRSTFCTDIQAVIDQKDIQGPPLLLASDASTPAPDGSESNPDEPTDPDFSTVFSHTLRGYDTNAPHFDGLLGARSEDFLIDLDTDSMERLPDVRAYLFYVGYDAVHDSRRNDSMDPLDREQEYVTAGRLALKAERDLGRGLFLAPRDWIAIREDENEPCAWMDHVESFIFGLPREAAALGHTGVWDYVVLPHEWEMSGGAGHPATNVRAPLFLKNQMLIGPGHPDWTYLVVSLYLNHPLALLRYTTIERQSYILRNSWGEEKWYTQEIVQFYRHHGGVFDHDPYFCVHCDPED